MAPLTEKRECKQQDKRETKKRIELLMPHNLHDMREANTRLTIVLFCNNFKEIRRLPVERRNT